MTGLEKKKTKVILVGLSLGKNLNFDHHMEELEALCEACGYEVKGTQTQVLSKPHSAMYIGIGKVKELKSFAEELEAERIIFDETLSPSQVRNLNEMTGLPVMDRTNVILQIFASRAKTKEAVLQVELARCQYMLPRIRKTGKDMSRQGGTSGSLSSRGAGETRLELDRRRIEHRINELSTELEKIKKQRSTRRKSRLHSRIPQVSLVGYTNAGKSTILNRFLMTYGNQDVDDILQKTVLQEDMLFATLDTAVRKLTPSGKGPFYLSDTVGFIEKLPHYLVDAFRSTLEEACNADLLLQVVDVHDPYYKEHMKVTEKTLANLGAGAIPMIIVYNKSDLVEELADRLPLVSERGIYMAAGKDIGLDELLDLIYDKLYGPAEKFCLLLPYAEGGLYNQLSQKSEVLLTQYQNDGIYTEVMLPFRGNLYDLCQKYIL